MSDRGALVTRQTGTFRAAARVRNATVPGIGTSWRRATSTKASSFSSAIRVMSLADMRGNRSAQSVIAAMMRQLQPNHSPERVWLFILPLMCLWKSSHVSGCSKPSRGRNCDHTW